MFYICEVRILLQFGGVELSKETGDFLTTISFGAPSTVLKL